MTILRASGVVVVALALSACTKTVQDSSSRTVAPKPKHVKPPKPSNIDAMQTTAARNSGVRDTLNKQVRNAVDAGDGDLRVQAWRRALVNDPDNLEARLSLAHYYKQLGYPEIALEHYRLAAARFPQNAEVVIGLSRTLEALDQPEHARAALQDFVHASPDASAEVWSWLGILQDEARDYASAEHSHKEAVRLKDNSDAVHNNYGYNLLLQGRYPEAVREFRHSLEVNPGSSLARNNLATALAGEQGDAALTELRASADPATAHSNLAAILIERGDLEAARSQVEAALRYQKDHPAALTNLHLIAELQGGRVNLSADGTPVSPMHRFFRSMGDVLFGSKDEPKSKQMSASQSVGGSQ